MKRRAFLQTSGLAALLAGVSVTITGCGSDEATGPGPGGVSGVIGGNHGHSVSITASQLDAGVGLTLSMGGGSHSHTVVLSDAQVESIALDTKVTVNSSSDSGHTHGVTFN